jgi:hypothetical protein
MPGGERPGTEEAPGMNLMTTPKATHRYSMVVVHYFPTGRANQSEPCCTRDRVQRPQVSKIQGKEQGRRIGQRS